MKHLLSMVAVFVMFFVGCSNQENNITGPGTSATSTANTLQLAKKGNPIIKITQMIDGVMGGYVRITGDYIDLENRLMTVEAALFFQQGSFEGTEIITMTADFKSVSVSFDPHMQFNKSVSLCVEYRGLPLAEMGYDTNCKVDFVYFGDDGNIYSIGSKGVSMQFKEGRLKVTNSLLRHFSRYGFVRRSY